MTFQNFNTIKDYIVYTVINKKSNEDFLLQVPYVSYLDLAIVFYYLDPDFNFEEERELFLIRNDDLLIWNVDVAALMNAASANTPRLMGLKIQGIISTIAEYMEDESAKEFAEMNDSYIPMYVASNKRSCYGAAVLLYKDLLSALSAKLKSDLYIIPCSIHEIIVIRVTKDCQLDIEKLKELISHVNSNELKESDVLSDSLYFFSRENNLLCYA